MFNKLCIESEQPIELYRTSTYSGGSIAILFKLIDENNKKSGLYKQKVLKIQQLHLRLS